MDLVEKSTQTEAFTLECGTMDGDTEKESLWIETDIRQKDSGLIMYIRANDKQ